MTERVLLVGGGGREHAIARALAPDCDLYACAGNRNPGVARLAKGFAAIAGTDVDAVVDYADAVDATLAVVGPEGPLAAGLVDALEDAGVYAFAPRRADARIETDKAWQRAFMAEYDIPGTPAFATFEDVEAACAHVREVDGDVAVKPTGLTGGKGVRVTGDQLDADGAVAYMRESGWDEWVVEERLVGEEFTVQALVADGEVRLTPAVQDHKRAFAGDEGPNTGGMGSYADVGAVLPFMTTADYDAAGEIIEAVVDALPDYRGVLYGQFMLTADGPMVVEFNARFGDPEAMNVLPVLRTPLLAVATAARDGEPLPELEFAPRATVCKYGVPEGYPTDPQAGTKLTIDAESVARAARSWGGESAADSGGGPDDEAAQDADDGESSADDEEPPADDEEPPTDDADASQDARADAPRATRTDALLFYASVDEREDGVYTTTSRSFAVVGLANTITEAEAVADAALAAAPAEGVRIRHDIGTPELVRRRIEHMRELRGG